MEWLLTLLFWNPRLDANSTEHEESTPEPVVIFMPEISKTHLGGTMRLGLRPTVFQKDTEWSVVRQLYGGNEVIWERHRHRWEINPDYVDKIESNGLFFTGRDSRGERMQVAELKREWETCRGDPLEGRSSTSKLMSATDPVTLRQARSTHTTWACRRTQNFARDL